MISTGRLVRELASAAVLLIAISCTPDPAPRPVPVRVADSEVIAPPVAEPVGDVPVDEVVDTSDLEVPAKPVVLPPKERPYPPSTEPTMAVRIGTSPIGSAITIGCETTLRVAPHDEAGTSKAWRVEPPIEIRATKQGWSVDSKGSKGKGIRKEFARCELIIVADGPNPRPVKWNKIDWPGSLRLVEVAGGQAGTAAPATAIDLVMDIAMEQYIPGVIAKELYGSWDEDTFEAQAIAARSFAVVEKDRWVGRRHYDLVAGQQSQAWAGATTNEKALRAVRDTRGQLLVEGGRVVPAYYSSACGGRPASALGTLTDNPHHDIASVSAGSAGRRSGPCCQESTEGSWSVKIPLAAVRARLVSWGKANGRPDLAGLEVPTAIEVKERNAAGRASVILIKCPKRSCEISAEDFRWAINAPRNKATTLKSGDLTAKIVGRGEKAVVEIDGRGFGHGVGMCQHGAQAMAKGGASAKKILERYYPGAKIEQAWK